ncbi:hypothetical protein PUNSTDRAFT_89954 [Punctularia strigosozonata HHB-11173 SS5]|uniref:uncharacterized protein n=1 Tax=Punctularia strigosozonata (strain HHB-11173) TaxID=741275 RepID=UPI000441862E|nr:uncharacterized protein PUNSTDRAFT_89954 [Punctularia strigosozonata HHB-11173 SS5]EIN06399.1 hypothetical protein PUNSTDRAFT_89954 [Punctularia strigosozonata HHB-11173 SS5]
MVLKILGATLNAVLPSNYYKHAAAVVVGTVVIRAFAQGRTTDRERDLHARTVLLTGGFTPLGLTLAQQLAQRGAHLILLSSEPINSPRVELLVELLRTQTSNDQIFADECDLKSPASIKAFCTKFLTGNETRLDAIVFAHEYQHIGAVLGSTDETRRQDEKEREAGSMATFLITTLLLPALLVAPVERDIRIVNVVNPFYAAAAPHYSPMSSLPLAPSPPHSSPTSSHAIPTPPSPASSSVYILEGHRALRTAILTRHLQRILDALPNRSAPPPTESESSTIPVVSGQAQRSNIVAVSVSPGISRSDTVSRILGADRDSATTFSWLGLLIYILLQPVLFIFTKSSSVALQSVLHVLFLPTPFKSLENASTGPTSLVPKRRGEEILKPGALYADCSVVRVQVPTPPTTDDPSADAPSSDPTPAPAPTTAPEKPTSDSNVDPKSGLQSIPDDHEYGGELVGRLTWESFEQQLRDWERTNPEPAPHHTPAPQTSEKGAIPSTPPQTAPVELEEEGADVYH